MFFPVVEKGNYFGSPAEKKMISYKKVCSQYFRKVIVSYFSYTVDDSHITTQRGSMFWPTEKTNAVLKKKKTYMQRFYLQELQFLHVIGLAQSEIVLFYFDWC